jgi:predicted phosphodiesterase
MRVAAIYDIHGNLPALEAVVQDIRGAGVNQIIVGGDVVPGPMPNETLKCLLELNLPTHFIQGNGEVAVLAARAGSVIGSLPKEVQESVRWVAQQLGAEGAQLISGWPKTLRLEISGLGEVLFCHATPRNENEIFTRLTTEERLLPVFAGVTSPIVICGHTHMQFERRIGNIRVVNAGSVGMPFGEPGAYWLLIGPGLQFRRTPYDLANAAERIRATSYPQAQKFAPHNVLQPPLERETLEMLEKVALKQ